jgi:predicted nucleic acid-binding protein
VILADTSVWVDHLRRSNPRLQRLLEAGDVACHSFVIGELACGNLRRRQELLDSLVRLPALPPATDFEVLAFIEARRLMGRGIGWVDAHLLAATVLSGAVLWTLDQRLGAISRALGVGGTP